MDIILNTKDKMTPMERKRALEQGKEVDRVPCVPFMSEIKCRISGASIWDFWHDPKKMADTEIMVFNRYGQDRIIIGPNSRGITDALGATAVYPEEGVPYMEQTLVKTYEQLDDIEPVDAKRNERILTFARAAEILQEKLKDKVPAEMSIGGPFTIASNIRGVEKLLRDCRKQEENVQKLLRIVTDSQKSCIDLAAQYGMGIAMADPVANPSLIGPRFYEKFVLDYTKELTEYAKEKTGQKVSLHMCGETYKIWKYFIQYDLNEISVDNVIDLHRAAEELGEFIPISGNVDPVEIMMNGTKEEIIKASHACIEAGLKSEKGFTLATGCDIPNMTDLEHIDWMMEAARTYPYR